MSTQTLTADETQIADSDTYVDSAETRTVRAVLPAVDDGSGTSVAVGAEIRFEATGGSPIEILTNDERRVGFCPGRGEVVAVALSGAAESETDSWGLRPVANSPSAFQTVSAPPTQAEVQAIRDTLVDQGLMKAE